MKEITKNNKASISISTSNIEKLDKLLDNVTIEVNDSSIVISSEKDLIIASKGNFLIINDGFTIIKSKEIHLNPIKRFNNLLKTFVIKYLK